MTNQSVTPLPFNPSVFSVLMFDESNGQIMTDEVYAANSDSAIGIAVTGRKDQGDFVVICTKDENGKLEYPGESGVHISDILEQKLFFVGVSERMFGLMVLMVNRAIDSGQLVGRGINPNTDEENVFTIYNQLTEDAEQLEDEFSIMEDDFVALFNIMYPGYQFHSKVDQLSVSLNFTIDVPADDKGESSLESLSTDELKAHLIALIEAESESELRGRLEVFDQVDLDELFAE